MGFSAPKRWFRKAVQRNRCKRLLRECWRHQRLACEQALTQTLPGHQLHLFWMLSQPGEPPMDQLVQAMNTLIDQLLKKLPHDAQALAGAAPDRDH